MTLALQSAALEPDDVDYVAAHGTSTPKNDAIETLAVERAFGAHAARLLVSSLKGHVGHTLAAAGALNAVSAVMAISAGEVAPTVGLRTPIRRVNSTTCRASAGARRCAQRWRTPSRSAGTTARSRS